MVGWRHLVYKHNVTTCHCLTVFGQAVRMGWRAGLKALLLRRLRSSGTGGTVRNVADRGAAVLARALPAVACRRKRGCVPRREIGRTYHVKGLTTVPSSVKRDGGSQWVFPRTNPHLMRSNLRRAPRPQRWKRGLARRAVRERGESVRMVAGWAESSKPQRRGDGRCWNRVAQAAADNRSLCGWLLGRYLPSQQSR
jgi:hypothetical protein